MEVRYVFLHPPVLEEILYSTALIRSVIKNVEHAEVYSAVPEQLNWALEDNPYVSGRIIYDGSPSKKIRELRDLQADYLVDLTGGKNTRWFKNRFRVMDFTIPWRVLREIRNTGDIARAFEIYQKAGLEMLKIFDLEKDNQGMDFFYAHNRSFVEKALPGSFLDNYAVIDIPPDIDKNVDLSLGLSELISRIERPVVLCGDEKWRFVSEEVMRRTGCTILGTCGDFSFKEQVYLRSGANVLINIEKGKEIWSLVFGKPHFAFNIQEDPLLWKEQIDIIRNHLKKR